MKKAIMNWIKEKKTVVTTTIAMAFAGLTANPVFAEVSTEAATNNLRNELKAPYLLLVAIVAVFMWLKGSVAKAISTVAIGLILGSLLLWPDIIQSLMEWIKGILF